MISRYSAFCLVPVTALLEELIDGQASVGQRLDGELGAVLRVNVLRIAHDHDIVDRAVAVEVALVLGGQNDVALHGAGLTGVSANVAEVAVEFHILSGRLTVDEHDRDAGGVSLLDDGGSRGRLDEVDDHDVDVVSDERVDLVGLLGLVVLAVHDGDVLGRDAAIFNEIALQLGAVRSHESIGELIDGDADLRGVSHSHAAGRDDDEGHQDSENLLHRNTLSYSLFQRIASVELPIQQTNIH